MLQPDTCLQNRYRIECLIGQGGMGAVYRALDLRLNNPVALKHQHVTGTATATAFAREAQLLHALRHPVLPNVMDYFTDEPGQFLVMEFIPGDDLAMQLTRRDQPFAVAEVLRWADQVLDALDYLHTWQPPIIHRDIKPQNVKLTPRGDIVLLDFGLAKGGTAHPADAPGQSVPGYTPEYAPLEQIRGGSSSPRSDLYALAATLHHLLTGRPPEAALTRVAALVARGPDPQRPVYTLNPQVPAAVGDLLMQALALRPADRPASAAAMRQALQAAVGQGKTGATPAYTGVTVAAPPAATHQDLPVTQRKGTTMSYNRLEEIEFEDNPEPRCAVMLLLDTSTSMTGGPIKQLNIGLQMFDRDLKVDRLAALRVEVGIITFGKEVQVISGRDGQALPFDARQAFVTVDQLVPPTLVAGGATPLGEAVRWGLTLLQERKEIYKNNGIDYFRPWMFLLTDGAPTDEWLGAAALVREEEERKGLSFYGIGVDRAHMQTLARFSTQRPPLKLRGLAFHELFQWLSRSLSTVSHSRPGEQIPLPPVGWAQFEG